MHLKFISLSIVVGLVSINRCFAQANKLMLREIQTERQVIVGAEQTTKYFPLLKNKTVAVVANQTSLIKTTHLVDSLIAAKIKIKYVFAPEHGFRGEAGAGEQITNSTDSKTGIPVISLYGASHKPRKEDLEALDFIIFDIQDVGVRFYTYISTLQLVMEACAENNIQLIILDRPNPNGHYVDGPVLDKKFASFVGMNPVPIVHGLTVAEYAQMVNAENWLAANARCRLKIIKCINYDHRAFYSLPVKPSPNLPNMSAVYLYPTLCLFEGTSVSVGRGTPFPFQVLGYPGFSQGDFSFTPLNLPGIASNPPYSNILCNGIDLREFGNEYIKNYRSLYLYWLKAFYDSHPDKSNFFNNFFDKLAGTDKLRLQLIEGISEEKIKQSWHNDLLKYKLMRKKYLLYDDFE